MNIDISIEAGRRRQIANGVPRESLESAGCANFPSACDVLAPHIPAHERAASTPGNLPG